jgi:hypothetical protein
VLSFTVRHRQLIV